MIYFVKEKRSDVDCSLMLGDCVLKIP